MTQILKYLKDCTLYAQTGTSTFSQIVHTILLCLKDVSPIPKTKYM